MTAEKILVTATELPNHCTQSFAIKTMQEPLIVANPKSN